MNNIQSALARFVYSNPAIANNNIAREYIDVIMNNDSKRGIEIANNICNQHGNDPNSAIQMAKKFFRVG